MVLTVSGHMEDEGSGGGPREQQKPDPDRAGKATGGAHTTF